MSARAIVVRLCSDESGGEHQNVTASRAELRQRGCRPILDADHYDDGVPTWQGPRAALAFFAEPIVPVIFRTFRGKDGGDVIAVFPTIAGSPGSLLCYQHVGQHGDCHWSAILDRTRPATPDEYAPLLREMTAIGYRLTVRRRRAP